MQGQNWEEKGTQRCAFEAPRSAPCRQGQVSNLGVQVESVQDVQKAVKFASDHNLRIAVKSSGHDYSGRSAATGSFLIWMHKMKYYTPNNISIDYTFTATDKNCKKFSTPAVTVTGGVEWGEVYDALKPTGYIVLGGFCLTICASGGYFQGGGHGVLGPSFGLAVDNVLQIEVVTADGKFHITNACKEPDLFFALRGGGGGTFGIVTSVTYKLHKNPDNFASTTLTLSPPNGAIWTRETQESVLAIWAKGMVAMDAAKWGGYWYFQETGFMGFFFVPDTVESANLTITPVVEELSKIEQVTPAVFTSKVATFQDWLEIIYSNSTTSPDATGARQLLGSRIIPYSALEDPSSLARSIVDAMAESGVKVLIGLQVIGPGVRKADPHGLTSATPAWRTGAMHVLATSAWSWNSTEAEEDSARQSVFAFTKSLQKSYPDSGAYFNEAGIDEPGWKQSFWGKSNYAKLLAIKMRVDPLGLFTCRKCVGSELRRNSGTCRVSQ
jgi:FAD/FMN-containing dehydrogenase